MKIKEFKGLGVFRGLMFRKIVDINSGMLFKFNNPQNLKFWGLNTYIPLDIAFISPDNKIVKIENIKPFSTKLVTSDTDCLVAIETNMGYFDKNKISVGNKIRIVEEDLSTLVYFDDE